MKQMFYGCRNYNQNLDNWKLDNIKNYKMMFDESPLENNTPKWYW
jgi:hypothetical protein